MPQLTIVYLTVSMVTACTVCAGSWEPTSGVVKVVNVSAGPPLEVVQVSTTVTTVTAGYVQTPGWGYLTLHPKDMNSVIQVQVPQNHSIMITMLHMNLTGRRHMCDTSEVMLVLYESRMEESNIVWRCFIENPVQRKLLSLGSNLYVHFQCGKARKVGFKLFFSIHETNALLRQISNDTWNCSVPSFQEFKPHFPCDLQPQCVNMEDERDCPYFSEDCGLGFATLGDRCLFMKKEPVTGTWWQIKFLCNRRGGTLVNVKRREEYDKLVGYLQPLANVWGFRVIWIGLHGTSKFLPRMYRNELQHSDNTIAFYRKTRALAKVKALCGLVDYPAYILLSLCTIQRPSSVLCETKETKAAKNTRLEKIQFRPVTTDNFSRLSLLRCPLGHVTRDFLACDFHSTCWSSHVKSCQAPLMSLPPSFTCANHVERVPYTLVCDFRSDCSDDSDESFCEFPSCDFLESFHCSNRQCVSLSKVCDGQKDCHNAKDENLCSRKNEIYISAPPPAIVNLSRRGKFTVHKLSQSQLAALSPAVCPETHFQCPENGYCMPVFLRCNGVYDCLGHEDEEDCNSYTCSGFYRCRGSRVCLHLDQLCDGIFQCPQNDDELLCDFNCPENCTCYGLALYCRKRFEVRNINTLRFVDARSSGISITDLKNNALLIYLSVTENSLTDVDGLNFPNLRYLDLSDNKLKDIGFQDFSRLPQLDNLSLSGNPLLYLFNYVKMSERQNQLSYYDSVNTTSAEISLNRYIILTSLRTLDLSRVKIRVLNPSFLSSMPNLHTFNMSGDGMDTVLGKGFQALTHLRTLDLRGCPLTHFPRSVFLGLDKLETVHSENMKICCPATLPAGFLLRNCHAPHDEMSSCEALLKFTVYRIFLSVFAVLALVGNASSLFYRVLLRKKKRLLSFDMFVLHLCGSDFLMGVYLSVIGVADRVYLGTYLWEDLNWMNSTACQTAGFLCLVSSEVSALIICLITVDRFLVLRFPFSTFHFGVRSAHMTALCAWVLGFLIATIPLTPGAADWQLYGRTGICIPLPVSRSDSPGFAYVLGVMIVANCIFFVATAAGQVFIYCSIHINSVSASDTTKRPQDVTIARRLITIAMSDFLCWFPIGLVGILAATGTPITREVNVAMAIFVLPFNSALNPFLYTHNILLENRRKADEERLKIRLMTQFQSYKHTLT